MKWVRSFLFYAPAQKIIYLCVISKMTYNTPYQHIPKWELYAGLMYSKPELEQFLRIILKDISTYENELLKSPNDDTVSLLSDARLWAKATLSRLLITHSKFSTIANENDMDGEDEYEDEEVCTKEDCRACCCSCKGYEYCC